MKKNNNTNDAPDENMSGFLGTDRRPLPEIIRADEKELKKLNLTNRIIAARMTWFRDAAQNAFGDFVRVAPGFEAACEVARGFLPCPFGDPGLHRKTTVVVRNLRLKTEITFSDLNIHCIAAHGFYEGQGSPFRLEPAELARILEIK